MSVHRGSRPPTGAEGGPVIQQQPQTTTISHANCRKVFIQRDYSEGSGVRFSTRFPVELQDKIEQEHFEYTVKMMNNMYAEAEKANCSTFCEGCMACLTAYVIYFCSETHYEKCLKKVARFVVEQNEQGKRLCQIVRPFFFTIFLFLSKCGQNEDFYLLIQSNVGYE